MSISAAIQILPLFLWALDRIGGKKIVHVLGLGLWGSLHLSAAFCKGPHVVLKVQDYLMVQNHMYILPRWICRAVSLSIAGIKCLPCSG